MRLEEYEKLGRKQLRSKVNECFAKAETAGMDDRPGLLLEAQFYTRELEHRSDSRTSIRDFVLEIVVIALIGWEIHMGYKQENQQSTEFGQQQQVLQNLENSSAATAATLTSLQGTTELMNAALQKQLALFYDISVIAQYDPGAKQILVLNNGRTNVTLWGSKFSDDAPAIEKEGRTIAPNGGYHFEGSRAYSLIAERIPKGTTGLIPFELYLKNEKLEEFVEHCYFSASWDKDALKLGIQITSITPEHWSLNAKKTVK